MAILKMATGEPAGQCVELKADVTVIGRAPECEIVLDPNGVSRKHAEIHRQGDNFRIVDLNSRNKTRVNDLVLEPGKGRILQDGDRINICDVEFVYHHDSAVAAAAPRDDREIVVTEGIGGSEYNHYIDASRAAAVVCAIRPEVKLGAILEITRNLCSDLNIDTVAPKVLDSLFEIFPQVERGFLVLREENSQRLLRKAFKYRSRAPFGRRSAFGATTYEDEAPMSISRSIINHVIEQKKAILSQDAGADSNLPTSASIADLKIRSIMCAPLLTPEGEVLGILQLDTSDRKQFHQEDLDVLVSVAGQASIALENARMHESLIARDRLDRDLQLAQQVQKRFLPQTTPRIAGFEFFAHYSPAFEVGGDYYDFVPLPDNRLAIAVGDVSGKGVAAALMMAKFSGDTRYSILTENEPAPAASRLNDLLLAAGIEEKFITLGLTVLDIDRREFDLASAGHLPVLVRRADGSVESIGDEITGLPLGIEENLDYHQVKVSLNRGDVAVVYTDGVTDSRNTRDELFDTKDNPRLSRRLAETHGGPEAIGKALVQTLREFSAGHYQADDITLICFGPT
jgi:sigma-B regulation protein RsbU (phosphoserine phosphatase)